jgi:betaine-homocysteine S-methyltransferase
MPDLSALLERGPVVCAEGYLFECERRGYLQAGAFVPEVVLDHPDVVEELHREFVHAGSDVVEAFTYYGHRQKLRVVGKEDILEPLNRQALSIAAGVARQTGTLLAGNICNTNVYEPGSQAVPEVRAAFEEQVAWAAEAGADMIIAETFSWVGEALLALEAIRGTGLPAVVTFAAHRDGTMRDGGSPEDACRQAEQAGASVVGLNCIRGPRTMLPLLERIRDAVSCEVAALPVPTGRPSRSRRCRPCAIPHGAARRPSRPRSTRSPAPALNWVSSPPRRSRSASATWASAAAPPRITSAP